jgi:Zn-dependent peptidase ImmA (M78 family)
VAELGTDNGRTVIRVAHGLPIAAGRFAAAHELGHAVLEHERRRDDQIEAEADRFAAAMLMPWRAFHCLRAEVGDDLEGLADVFLVTQTAVALRLGEVGEVAASIVVAPGCVRARSLEEIVLPTEEDLRWLARASDEELERVGPGIKKATLTDDPRRVALVLKNEAG